jgi:hypothetical protein
MDMKEFAVILSELTSQLIKIEQKKQIIEKKRSTGQYPLKDIDEMERMVAHSYSLAIKTLHRFD